MHTHTPTPPSLTLSSLSNSYTVRLFVVYLNMSFFTFFYCRIPLSLTSYLSRKTKQDKQHNTQNRQNKIQHYTTQHSRHIPYCTVQLPYIPQVVFPFVVLYGSDELSVFEMVMTVFMWWGHSFFATYPHPPVHIVGTYVRKV